MEKPGKGGPVRAWGTSGHLRGGLFSCRSFDFHTGRESGSGQHSCLLSETCSQVSSRGAAVSMPEPGREVVVWRGLCSRPWSPLSLSVVPRVSGNLSQRPVALSSRHEFAICACCCWIARPSVLRPADLGSSLWEDAQH